MSGYDSNTVALLHFNESAIKDECGNTWEGNGTPLVSAENSKFGGKSLRLNGTLQYIRMPMNSNIDFKDGDFTIDWWEYRESSNGVCSSVTLAPLTSIGGGGTTSDSFVAFYNSSNADTPRMYITSSGSSWDIANGLVIGSNHYGEWVHRAFSRKKSGSSNWYYFAFENGVLTKSIYTDRSMYYNSNYYLSIGARDGRYMVGYIDELRISNCARWVKDFTVPTSAYSKVAYVYLKDKEVWGMKE